jgi:hypothetical protein
VSLMLADRFSRTRKVAIVMPQSWDFIFSRNYN